MLITMMVRAAKPLSGKQQALLNSASPKEYFEAVLEARKRGEEWAQKIPLDMNVIWAGEGKYDVILKNQIAQRKKDRGPNE